MTFSARISFVIPHVQVVSFLICSQSIEPFWNRNVLDLSFHAEWSLLNGSRTAIIFNVVWSPYWRISTSDLNTDWNGFKRLCKQNHYLCYIRKIFETTWMFIKCKLTWTKSLLVKKFSWGGFPETVGKYFGGDIIFRLFSYSFEIIF